MPYIENTFRKPCEYVDRLVTDARKLVASEERAAIASDSKVQMLGLYMLARATGSLRSCKLLFCAGEENDAASVMRTIAELLIDYQFIVADPATSEEQAKLYDEWVYVANWNRYQSLKKVPQLAWATTPLDSDEQRLKDEYDAAIARYPNPKQWSKHDLAFRAQKGSCAPIYELAYRYGCDSSHSSPNTLQDVFNPVTRSLVVDPLIPDSAYVLFLAVYAFRWIVSTVSDQLRVPGRAEVDDIAKELAAVFGHAKGDVAGKPSG